MMGLLKLLLDQVLPARPEADELEITSRVLGQKGKYSGTIVLIRNKSTGEVVAEGRHSLFGSRKVTSSVSAQQGNKCKCCRTDIRLDILCVECSVVNGKKLSCQYIVVTSNARAGFSSERNFEYQFITCSSLLSFFSKSCV
ncbi:hypothetical protein Leryth_025930 [Lithospermum erythrorhizon]|nr:hypothetical protein Leryth_025930 [Lithospermum erythrorhizon]